LINTGQPRHRCCSTRPARDDERQNRIHNEGDTRGDVLQKLSVVRLAQRRTTGWGPPENAQQAVSDWPMIVDFITSRTAVRPGLFRGMPDSHRFWEA
jgi:hypothetical protein